MKGMEGKNTREIEKMKIKFQLIPFLMKCIVRAFFFPWEIKCVQMTSCYVSLVIYPDNVQIFKNIWSLEYFVHNGQISETLTIPCST